MSEIKRPPCRLFILMAREAETAVIFRRGPSKWTRLIKWNTKTDTFEFGQWFKGRIYEKRCDLSPDGNLLIYFVSKFNKRTLSDSGYTYAWTAISKPPWLTALALWPKGDCWHGGGLFEGDKLVMLNHRPHVAKPHPKHLPAKWLTVVPNPNAAGENDPLYSMRLTRDGWQLTQKLQYKRQGHRYVTNQPEIRVKTCPNSDNPYTDLILQREINGFKTSERFGIKKPARKEIIWLENAECARWDQQSRLVFASEGKLWAGHISAEGLLVKNEIADFSAQQPEPLNSPAWAQEW